jgi:serine/threonine protein kinase
MLRAYEPARHRGSAVAQHGNILFGPGHRIGDYEVIGHLGAGGMGSVYKVRHVISDRVEALKIIRTEASAAPGTAERFLREIRLQASLNHQNIAAVHNAFRVDDELMMIVEFIDGVSLRAKLETAGITIGQAIDYTLQVLSALSYAHARGVIHRDIKPSNVMIESDQVVKLLDFGLATSGRDPYITQPGTMLGSPHYMSPEQARGEHVDARSDLYSTGAMLFEMVTGRPPFDAAGAYAVVAGHLHQAPPQPRECNPNVPADLSRIILKALSKRPDDRLQTADEFKRALQVGLLEESTATMVTTPVPRNRPESPSPADRAEDVAPQYGPAEIERASKDLAAYIGPIAHIMVRRAAARCQTLSELYQTLSEEISSVTNRQQFLAAMPSGGASRSAS